jgi:signal transduction histidine kinase
MRRVRHVVRRLAGNLGLPQRFLLVSFVVVALAMVALGALTSHFVRDAIVDGVASTSASSVDSLIARSIEGIAIDQPLSPGDRAQLDAFFQINSDRESTRLIQVQIRRLDGSLLYEASEGIVDPDMQENFEIARMGGLSSDIVDLALDPAGPFGSHALSLLRIFTPLHRPDGGEIFAVALLYYSAKSIGSIQFWAQASVWAAVMVTGLVVIFSLYAFVLATNRTIQKQRRGLADNLEESRALAEEVRGLHLSSERLRLDAIEANEQLLARVGSDIHDGPLQLLTLIIIQLTRSQKDKPKTDDGELPSAVKLTQTAMTDLRNISAGLVLPELAQLSLRQTIEFAAQRHEAVTGTHVRLEIDGLDHLAETAIKTCVYRVVQEALSNAFRHTGGLDQKVVASHTDGHVAVEISNRLPAVRHPAKSSGDSRPKLGLRGMQLRVEAIGGGLFVRMSDDQIVVRMRAPISHSDR